VPCHNLHSFFGCQLLFLHLNESSTVRHWHEEMSWNFYTM
jgi:hypothetical protein